MNHGIIKPEEFTETALERMSHLNHSFLGGGMSQSYTAIYFLEYYIRSHQFTRVFEFGTGKGTLSLYLATLAAVTDQFEFDTFDHADGPFFNRPENGVGHWFVQLEKIARVKHHVMDIFTPSNIEMIGTAIKLAPRTLVLCDNGNKAEEVRIFKEFLKPGDRIMAHDWETEIKEHQIDFKVLAFDEPYHNYSMTLKTHWGVMKLK